MLKFMLQDQWPVIRIWFFQWLKKKTSAKLSIRLQSVFSFCRVSINVLWVSETKQTKGSNDCLRLCRTFSGSPTRTWSSTSRGRMGNGCWCTGRRWEFQETQVFVKLLASDTLTLIFTDVDLPSMKPAFVTLSVLRSWTECCCFCVAVCFSVVFPVGH